jgi:hypothetical protein
VCRLTPFSFPCHDPYVIQPAFATSKSHCDKISKQLTRQWFLAEQVRRDLSPPRSRRPSAASPYAPFSPPMAPYWSGHGTEARCLSAGNERKREMEGMWMFSRRARSSHRPQRPSVLPALKLCESDSFCVFFTCMCRTIWLDLLKYYGLRE